MTLTANIYIKLSINNINKYFMSKKEQEDVNTYMFLHLLHNSNNKLNIQHIYNSQLPQCYYVQHKYPTVSIRYN